MSKRAQCDNCQWEGPEHQLQEIQHLAQRVDAGGEVPAGECPKCGALAYITRVVYTALPAVTADNPRLARMVRVIDEFEHKTQEAEYTDIGEAWETFYLLRDIAIGKVPT